MSLPVFLLTVVAHLHVLLGLGLQLRCRLWVRGEVLEEVDVGG